jgi:hypothetical protein
MVVLNILFTDGKPLVSIVILVDQSQVIQQSEGMRPLARFQTILAKPFMPAVFFFSGVAYDTLTLTRIDRLLDNLLLLVYLLLLGLLIILTGRLGIEPFPDRAQLTNLSPVARWLLKSRPYYPMAIQFFLGGLFSAYAIFYSRSATLTSTAVFFGVLVLMLVANEFLRDRLSNLRLLVSLYALVCFAFFTFFLPVMTGFMNLAVFLGGAILSGIVTFRVVQLIYRNNPDRSRREAIGVITPGFAVIAALVGFYFLNWIPPVPLSMTFGGIYHEVKKSDDQFELSFDRKWYQLWKRSDTIFPAGEPVYCFTAVFAPVALKATVYHHWYVRQSREKPFTHADRIPLRISGGRDGGFRAYTFKQRLDPGDWRVDVETEDGRVIGRVSVRVQTNDEAQPHLTTIAY